MYLSCSVSLFPSPSDKQQPNNESNADTSRVSDSTWQTQKTREDLWPSEKWRLFQATDLHLWYQSSFSPPIVFIIHRLLWCETVWEPTCLYHKYVMPRFLLSNIHVLFAWCLFFCIPIGTRVVDVFPTMMLLKHLFLSGMMQTDRKEQEQACGREEDKRSNHGWVSRRKRQVKEMTRKMISCWWLCLQNKL